MNGRLHLSWRFPLAFGALLACLVMLLWLGWRAQDELAGLQRLRLQSEQVLATLEAIEREAVPEANVALCASVGAPVGTARPAVDPAPLLAKLRGWFDEPSAQSQRVDSLAAALTEWRLAYAAPLEKACADGQRLGAAYVQSLLRVAVPNRERVRTELEALRRIELGLQAERSMRAETAAQSSRRTFALVALVSVVLGVAALLSMRSLGAQVADAERRLRREATQRGMTEEQLNETQKRLRMLLEHCADAVLAFDARGKLQWINPAAEALFHRSRAALAGESVGQLIPDLDGDLDWPVTRPLAETDGLTPQPWSTRRETVEGTRAGGQSFALDIVLVQMRHEGGRIGLVLCRDRTEAERVQRLKREFVALVGKDLREPLGRMQAAVAAAGATPVLEAGLRQQLAMARADGERTIEMLEDVLELEQLASGDLPTRIEPLDLVGVAREALAGVAARAARQQVVLLPQFEARPLPVMADARQLAEVLRRLLVCAIDATPAGGDVQLIAAATPQGQAQIAVVDSGSRPSAEFIERAFEPFPDTEPAGVRVRGGNGVTLAVCRGLLQQIGGELAIEPVPADRGARAHFSLPLRSIARVA
ncbi:MAG TPA: ATP-binding protein [Methylibium sp.]|uniref:sensor histidine kinase n=1 Tax=Methylibium sp. TaxID=2067992 RepID=UPI002DBCB22A|nr:ATP-binding protein [Methylibium sp.]HEU4459847.1 ATP-binding protein [Methylibium sp.]